MSGPARNALGLFMVFVALVTVAPSPEAVDPIVAPASSFLDDDFSGSGLETGQSARNQPNRRVVRRLRLRSDDDRVATLRAIAAVPALIDEHFPEFRADASIAAVLLPLILARYEGRPVALDRLIEDSRLPRKLAEAAVTRLVERGLAAFSRITVARDAVYVAPTPMLYQRSRIFLDRVHDSLADIVDA